MPSYDNVKPWVLLFKRILEAYASETPRLVYIARGDGSLNIKKIVSLIRSDHGMEKLYYDACRASQIPDETCTRWPHHVIRRVIYILGRRGVEPIRTILVCAYKKGYLDRSDIETGIRLADDLLRRLN